MSNQNKDVIIYQTVGIPEITPLPMGAPVMFFAPVIDVAIERGVFRLKRFIQTNPRSEEWVTFGWLDGGLTSQFVCIAIGAFRMIEGDVEYSPVTGEKLSPHFAIPFDRNWERVMDLAKKTLIQGYDISYQKKKSALLKSMKTMNFDPDK